MYQKPTCLWPLQASVWALLSWMMSPEEWASSCRWSFQRKRSFNQQDCRSEGWGLIKALTQLTWKALPALSGRTGIGFSALLPPCSAVSLQPYTSLFIPSRSACHSAASLAVAGIRTGEVFSGNHGRPMTQPPGGKTWGGRAEGEGEKEQWRSPLHQISLTLQEQTVHLSSFSVHTCPLCLSPPSWGQSPEQEGPEGQRQSKPPARLMQAESFQQVWVLKAHSSMSAIKKAWSFRLKSRWSLENNHHL